LASRDFQRMVGSYWPPETLASIASSYAVDISMIARLR
jgi:hypothetical protein